MVVEYASYHSFEKCQQDFFAIKRSVLQNTTRKQIRTLTF